MENLSRRRLLGTAGAAAGTAAIASAPSALGLDHGQETDPTGPPPEEAVIAYVRDAKRGEITVMAGTREVTLRDPVLVKRLLGAAPKDEE